MLGWAGRARVWLPWVTHWNGFQRTKPHTRIGGTSAVVIIIWSALAEQQRRLSHVHHHKGMSQQFIMHTELKYERTCVGLCVCVCTPAPPHTAHCVPLCESGILHMKVRALSRHILRLLLCTNSMPYCMLRVLVCLCVFAYNIFVHIVCRRRATMRAKRLMKVYTDTH